MTYIGRYYRVAWMALALLLLAGGALMFVAPSEMLAQVTTLPASVESEIEAEVEAPAAVTSETLIKSTKTWDGNSLPAYPEEQPEITMLKITIPAGVELPVHKHPYINVGILMEGELTVYTEENEVLQLRKGDPIIELVDKWHYGVNHGDEDAVIVVVYAGVVDEPITIHKEAADSSY